MEIYYDQFPQAVGLPESVEFDAIVIGSGATGGWAARDPCEVSVTDYVEMTAERVYLPIPGRYDGEYPYAEVGRLFSG